MPGMNSGLDGSDPLIVAAFRTALLHQGLIALLVIGIAGAIWAGLRARRDRSLAVQDEPAARRLLRIGFGLLWLFDGILQAQPGMPTGLLPQGIEPTALSSAAWVRHVVKWGDTAWTYHPVQASASAVWIQVGLGLWLRDHRRDDPVDGPDAPAPLPVRVDIRLRWGARLRGKPFRGGRAHCDRGRVPQLPPRPSGGWYRSSDTAAAEAYGTQPADAHTGTAAYPYPGPPLGAPVPADEPRRPNGGGSHARQYGGSGNHAPRPAQNGGGHVRPPYDPRDDYRRLRIK